MTPRMARYQAGVRGLLGFEVRPLPQEGAYEYRHTATGMRFQVRGGGAGGRQVGAAAVHARVGRAVHGSAAAGLRTRPHPCSALHTRAHARLATHARAHTTATRARAPQLRPSEAPSDGEDSELQAALGPGYAQLLDYAPLALGSAALPPHFRAPFQFEAAGRQAFMNQLWAALAGGR